MLQNQARPANSVYACRRPTQMSVRHLLQMRDVTDLIRTDVTSISPSRTQKALSSWGLYNALVKPIKQCRFALH